MNREELWVRTLQYVTDQGVPAGLRFRTARKVFDGMKFLLPEDQKKEEGPVDDQLIYKVCDYLRTYASDAGPGCMKCPLKVETSYGPGTMGCVLCAQEIIKMVRAAESEEAKHL